LKLNLSLGALASLQLAASFSLQLIVLAALGPGTSTDAFVAAQALPTVIFSILAVSLQNVWQPKLAMLSEKPVLWRKAQGTAQGQVLLLFGGMAVALITTARVWVPILFPGFSESQAVLTAYMSQILLIAMILNGQAALLTTAQRARDHFIIAEIVSLIATIVAAGALALILPVFGVEAAAWINLARAFIVTVILYKLAGRPPLELKRAWKEVVVWHQLRPMLAGSSIYKTGPIIDRFWSSHAPAGGITVFNLAQAGMGAFSAVLDRAISVPVVPRLARMVASQDYSGVRKLYRTCVIRITLFIALLFLLMLGLKPYWGSLALNLFRMHEPLSSQMWLISMLLLGYAHVAASGNIAVAAFYAMGDAKTPVKVGVLGFAFGALLKSLAFVVWGLPGLALATSIYYIINMAVIYILLEKKINERLS
jgi:putative peptidoglycan lipid II flippase